MNELDKYKAVLEQCLKRLTELGQDSFCKSIREELSFPLPPHHVNDKLLYALGKTQKSLRLQMEENAKLLGQLNALTKDKQNAPNSQ